MLAVGMAGGLGLGTALVLLRGWLRRRVQGPTKIERMGLPVFATINYSSLADTRGSRKGDMPILAISQPTDLTIEAFRSLRTSLHFGMLDAQTPTLTIPSTHPGAGKSFLAANLAVVAAEAGQRVCLIDADLRRGQLRCYFGLPRNHPGPAEVLAGDLEPEAVVQPQSVERLFFIGTGRYPPNPSELLMRPELNRLIDWCAAEFELVLFDTPPVRAMAGPAFQRTRRRWRGSDRNMAFRSGSPKPSSPSTT